MRLTLEHFSSSETGVLGCLNVFVFFNKNNTHQEKKKKRKKDSLSFLASCRTKHWAHKNDKMVSKCLCYFKYVKWSPTSVSKALVQHFFHYIFQYEHRRWSVFLISVLSELLFEITYFRFCCIFFRLIFFTFSLIVHCFSQCCGNSVVRSLNQSYVRNAGLVYLSEKNMYF